MAHALEVRVPFLDHRVVAEALSVSDEDKWPHTPKQLLTDALPDLLPREIIDRPKMGFTLPWEVWMRTSLKPLCEAGLEVLSGLDVFDEREVESIWNAFILGSPRWTFSRVWSLVVLGHWMKQNRIT
jgi:asparagine synthase (glutamine-hydrolysing)